MKKHLVFITISAICIVFITTHSKAQTNKTTINNSLPIENKSPLNSIVEPKTLIGEFWITAYCPCRICCGKQTGLTITGAKAEEGITIGADKNIIPYGAKLEIEGVGERINQDKPADWIIRKYNGKIIDIFCSSHKEALKFGKQKLKVWEIK